MLPILLAVITFMVRLQLAVSILNYVYTCVHIFQVVWLVWIIEYVTFTFAVMT